HQYMLLKSDEEIAEEFLKAEGRRQKAEISNKKEDVKEEGSLTEEEWDRVVKIISLVKERAEFVKDIWSQAWFFFEAPTTYDESVIKKRWSPEMPLVLKDLSSLITNFCLLPSAFCPEAAEYEGIIKDYIVSRSLNMGNVMNILRLCLVGSSMGPGVFDIMALLGPEEVIARIKRLIAVKG
ncbi:MAG: hypothetical protein WCW62_17670, partial [Bacteroidales bacterium]